MPHAALRPQGNPEGLLKGLKGRRWTGSHATPPALLSARLGWRHASQHSQAAGCPTVSSLPLLSVACRPSRSPTVWQRMVAQADEH